MNVTYTTPNSISKISSKMNKQQDMLKISSDTKNISRLEPFIDRLSKKYKFTPDTYGNILISLTEAVTNAIIHGNNGDKTKSVSVKTRKLKNCLAFLISDEGKGFDFNSIPDPTAAENIMKVGGRGVFLMRQLSDQLNFINNGSTVEIQFNL